MTTSATFAPFFPLPPTLASLALTPLMIKGSRMSTSSYWDERTAIGEDYIENQFTLLEKELGSELFNQLALTDKLFMLETAGSIDFGAAIDLDSVADNIADYGEEPIQ